MAGYNNFYPATYQPYGQSFFPNPYQPQMMPMQQPQSSQAQNQQTQPQISGIIWVGSDAEADAYPIAPNNAVTLWNRSQPIVYFKQADASGKPSMKIYDLVEHVNKIAESPQPERFLDYATKDDVSALEEAIKSIRNELKSVRKDMKKKEVLEDDDA